MQTELDLWVTPRCVDPTLTPVNQLSDVAKGLCYLHSCNVVHGDLKGVCDFLGLISLPD